MAGSRRGTGRPLRRDLQAQRTRARLIVRLATTTDPMRRLRHALDYLCCAAAHAPGGEQRLADLERECVARADAMWQEKP